MGHEPGMAALGWDPELFLCSTTYLNVSTTNLTHDNSACDRVVVGHLFRAHTHIAPVDTQ